MAIGCDGTNTIRVPIAFHFDEGFACVDVDCIITEVNDQMAALNAGFGDNSGSANAATCPAAHPVQDISTGTCIEFYMPQPPSNTGLGHCDLPITIGEFDGGYEAGGTGAGVEWEGILNVFVINDQCLGVSDGIPGFADGDGVSVCQEAFGGLGGPSTSCALDTSSTSGLGATLIHEIGHYLGLYHTFEGGCGTDETDPPGP